MELGLTIGAVARATDIPANTLRTWERRYGFPSPDRTEGGQRLYSPEVVPRLRLVTRALAMGLRARQVLTADVEQLRQLIGPSIGEQLRQHPGGDVVLEWIEAARRLDGEALDQGLKQAYATSSLFPFLTERVGPFLRVMGEQWEQGSLAVYQEHFAAEHLKIFLYGVWRDLAEHPRGPRVVCATLPTERHDLGLHMAACALATAGVRILFLGMEAPLEDLVSALGQSGARAVVLSVSGFAEGEESTAALRTLREALPAEVEVVVGGGGAPEGVPGVHVIHDFEKLSEWARALI